MSVFLQLCQQMIPVKVTRYNMRSCDQIKEEMGDYGRCCSTALRGSLSFSFCLCYSLLATSLPPSISNGRRSFSGLLVCPPTYLPARLPSHPILLHAAASISPKIDKSYACMQTRRLFPIVHIATPRSVVRTEEAPGIMQQRRRRRSSCEGTSVDT